MFAQNCYIYINYVGNETSDWKREGREGYWVFWVDRWYEWQYNQIYIFLKKMLYNIECRI
jgi:hypothetical protein